MMTAASERIADISDFAATTYRKYTCFCPMAPEGCTEALVFTTTFIKLNPVHKL